MPTDTFPDDNMYVWMDYPLQNFKYPSENYESDDTIYLNSPFTKFPDFTNNNEVECGQSLDYVDVNGITDATEGLCVFVRSPYLLQESDVVTLRYSYADGITDLASVSDPTEVSPETCTSCIVKYGLSCAWPSIVACVFLPTAMFSMGDDMS